MTDRPTESLPQLLMRREDLTGLSSCTVPPGCTVRKAVQGDEPGIAAVLSKAFDTDWDADKVLRALLQAPDVDSVYVVTAADEIVATASARLDPRTFPGDGYLHWVGVVPEWRGRGIGRAVCIRVLERFADLGLKGAVLETDDHRLDAVRLYLRLGFSPAYRSEADPNRWEAVLKALGE